MLVTPQMMPCETTPSCEVQLYHEHLDSLIMTVHKEMKKQAPRYLEYLGACVKKSRSLVDDVRNLVPGAASGVGGDLMPLTGLGRVHGVAAEIVIT